MQNQVESIVAFHIANLYWNIGYYENNEIKIISGTMENSFESLETKNIIDIYKIMIKKLKKIAENQLEKKILNVLIAVPLYFNNKKRQCVKNIANNYGLVAKLINQTSSISIANVYSKRLNFDDHKELKNIICYYDGYHISLVLFEHDFETIEIISTFIINNLEELKENCYQIFKNNYDVHEIICIFDFEIHENVRKKVFNVFYEDICNIIFEYIGNEPDKIQKILSSFHKNVIKMDNKMIIEGTILNTITNKAINILLFDVISYPINILCSQGMHNIAEKNTRYFERKRKLFKLANNPIEFNIYEGDDPLLSYCISSPIPILHNHDLNCQLTLYIDDNDMIHISAINPITKIVYNVNRRISLETFFHL